MKTLGTTDIRLIAPETLHYKEETPGLERFDNLDQGIEGVDVIISESVSETGIGVAMMDRLRRAAAGSKQ